MTILVGLDVGTTTIKAGAYDPEQGRIVALAARPTPVDHPAPGRSEHDPEALWQAAAGCLREAAAAAGRERVAGIAVTGFGEVGVPLDAAGRPLYPAIAWYDRRAEAQAAAWDREMDAAALHAITGQTSSPSLGVNKWLWIRENVPGAADRLAHWLSALDYILWRLTGEMATDYSLASRTMLFDQRTRAWSPALLARAGLSADQLPRLGPGGTVVGRVAVSAAEVVGAPAGTPCALGGHDHLVAAAAAGGYRPSAVIDSTGTAEALILVAPAFQTNPFMAAAGYCSYAHAVPGCYVLKGGLKLYGGLIDWLARMTEVGDRENSIIPTLEAEAAPGVGRRAGPLWLPHLLGSGTPEGDRLSRAALVGAKAEHDRGDVFRGLLESLAFWLRHNLEEMAGLASPAQASGVRPDPAPAGSGSPVVVLGGTARLQLLTQIKADVLERPILVPDLPEAAAAGAALLAGLGAGVFPDITSAAASLRYETAVTEPDAGRAAWYTRLYDQAYRPLYAALRPVNHALERLESTNISDQSRPSHSLGALQPRY